MFGKCKKCAALEEEVQYLRGLVDRLMQQTWPKPEPVDQPGKPTTDQSEAAESVSFGADREVEVEE